MNNTNKFIMVLLISPFVKFYDKHKVRLVASLISIVYGLLMTLLLNLLITTPMFWFETILAMLVIVGFSYNPFLQLTTYYFNKTDKEQ